MNQTFLLLFRHFATFRPIKMNNKEKLEQLVLQYAHVIKRYLPDF